MKLLCITAHPDDESGGFGGSLLLYHDRGVETHVLCLTPGQAATHRGGLETDEDLARARRAEFEAACGILKISSGVVLDYHDAQLDRANFYSVVGRLTRHIRNIRPQVVITFGTEGAITAHPDHSMASVFATMAYHWAGRSNRFSEQLTEGLPPHRAQKLYYSTATFTLPDRQPTSLAPITTEIDITKYLDAKVRAFKAHTTQSPLFPLFERSMRLRGSSEMYHLAASVHPGQSRHEKDLFEGVTEE